MTGYEEEPVTRSQHKKLRKQVRELYLGLNRQTHVYAEELTSVMSMAKTGISGVELRCELLENMLERQNARILKMETKLSSLDDWAGEMASSMQEASWTAHTASAEATEGQLGTASGPSSPKAKQEKDKRKPIIEYKAIANLKP